MKMLAEQLSIYYQHHTRKITRVTHYIGVPSLVFSLLILLSWIHISIPTFFHINLAWLLVIAVLIYYFILDIRLALAITIVIIPLTLLAYWVSHPAPSKLGIIVFLIFFGCGILLQFIGHLFEHKKPAFTHNFAQFLIAPLFIAAEIAFARGYRRDLETNIKAFADARYK